jgi:hypothetical protein
VFTAISGEREYQEALWKKARTTGAGDTTRGRHSVTEFLVYIQDYTTEAIHTVSRSAAPKCDDDALHIVRKIAAIATACMEQHGAPQRDSLAFEQERLKRRLRGDLKDGL